MICFSSFFIETEIERYGKQKITAYILDIISYKILLIKASKLSFATNEISLEDRCLRYWNKYFLALAETTDGELLLEEANLNVFRVTWLQNESRIKDISK